jgi:hypothetical protein
MPNGAASDQLIGKGHPWLLSSVSSASCVVYMLLLLLKFMPFQELVETNHQPTAQAGRRPIRRTS